MSSSDIDARSSLLGVTKGATDDDIKKGYKKMVRPGRLPVVPA
jgi:hypothetical protein